MKLVRVVVLLAVSTLPNSAAAVALPSPPTALLDAQKWDFRYSQRMPSHPTQLANGWFFDFPVDGGSIHYLTTSVQMSASQFVRAAVQVTTTGNPEFFYRLKPDNTCTTPAHVRLFLQRRGDNLRDEFGRWWANPTAYRLDSGSVVMKVPLDPSQWSSVRGKRGNASAAALGGFQRAISDLGHVGFTFGGGCFLGTGSG